MNLNSLVSTAQKNPYDLNGRTIKQIPDIKTSRTDVQQARKPLTDFIQTKSQSFKRQDTPLSQDKVVSDVQEAQALIENLNVDGKNVLRALLLNVVREAAIEHRQSHSASQGPVNEAVTKLSVSKKESGEIHDTLDREDQAMALQQVLHQQPTDKISSKWNSVSFHQATETHLTKVHVNFGQSHSGEKIDTYPSIYREIKSIKASLNQTLSTGMRDDKVQIRELMGLVSKASAEQTTQGFNNMISRLGGNPNDQVFTKTRQQLQNLGFLMHVLEPARDPAARITNLLGDQLVNKGVITSRYLLHPAGTIGVLTLSNISKDDGEPSLQEKFTAKRIHSQVDSVRETMNQLYLESRVNGPVHQVKAERTASVLEAVVRGALPKDQDKMLGTRHDQYHLADQAFNNISLGLGELALGVTQGEAIEQRCEALKNIFINQVLARHFQPSPLQLAQQALNNSQFDEAQRFINENADPVAAGLALGRYAIEKFPSASAQHRFAANVAQELDSKGFSLEAAELHLLAGESDKAIDLAKKKQDVQPLAVADLFLRANDPAAACNLAKAHWEQAPLQAADLLLKANDLDACKEIAKQLAAKNDFVSAAHIQIQTSHKSDNFADVLPELNHYADQALKQNRFKESAQILFSIADVNNEIETAARAAAHAGAAAIKAGQTDQVKEIVEMILDSPTRGTAQKSKSIHYGFRYKLISELANLETDAQKKAEILLVTSYYELADQAQKHAMTSSKEVASLTVKRLYEMGGDATSTQPPLPPAARACEIASTHTDKNVLAVELAQSMIQAGESEMASKFAISFTGEQNNPEIGMKIADELIKAGSYHQAVGVIAVHADQNQVYLNAKALIEVHGEFKAAAWILNQNQQTNQAQAIELAQQMITANTPESLQAAQDVLFSHGSTDQILNFGITMADQDQANLALRTGRGLGERKDFKQALQLADRLIENNALPEARDVIWFAAGKETEGAVALAEKLITQKGAYDLGANLLTKFQPKNPDKALQLAQLMFAKQAFESAAILSAEYMSTSEATSQVEQMLNSRSEQGVKGASYILQNRSDIAIDNVLKHTKEIAAQSYLDDVVEIVLKHPNRNALAPEICQHLQPASLKQAIKIAKDKSLHVNTSLQIANALHTNGQTPAAVEILLERNHKPTLINFAKARITANQPDVAVQIACENQHPQQAGIVKEIVETLLQNGGENHAIKLAQTLEGDKLPVQIGMQIYNHSSKPEGLATIATHHPNPVVVQNIALEMIKINPALAQRIVIETNNPNVAFNVHRELKNAGHSDQAEQVKTHFGLKD